MFDKFAERSLEWVGEKGLEIINGGVILVCEPFYSLQSPFWIVVVYFAFLVMLCSYIYGDKILDPNGLVYLAAS